MTQDLRQLVDDEKSEQRDQQQQQQQLEQQQQLHFEPIVEENNHGCCYKILHTIWRTKDTHSSKQNSVQDRDRLITTTLRELIIYCCFLLLLTIVAFGMTTTTMFYYNRAMQLLFLDARLDNKSLTNYRSIKNLPQLWQYLDEPLHDAIFWSGSGANKSSSSSASEFVLFESKLLGSVRLRQLRVKRSTCPIAPPFRQEIDSCFGPYSSSAESHEAFGDISSSSSNISGSESAWLYRDAAELQGRSVDGNVATYPPGGFAVDLPNQPDDASALLKQLKEARWVDRHTRAVLVEFTLYNANVNLFCVVHLLAELPASGGLLPSWHFQAVKLLRYVDVADYFVAACECAFLCFVVYYIVEEILEIYQQRLSYFKHPWNWLDICVICISCICAAFNIYRIIAVQQSLGELLVDESQHPDFASMSKWQHRFNQAVAFALFFSWVKLFKYVNFSRSMSQLFGTLGTCARDLAAFCVIFLLVFMAFAQLGFLTFGSLAEDFREIPQSVFTLFRIILGDFDFSQLERASPVLGPIYFMLYVFFVFFILINMFLAIINETYREVKEEEGGDALGSEISAFFRRKAQILVGEKLRKRRGKASDILTAARAAQRRSKMPLQPQELRDILKLEGYADAEIEAMIANFDVSIDRCLSSSQLHRMQQQMLGDTASNPQEEDNNCNTAAPAEAISDAEVLEKEFDALCHRVDSLEAVVYRAADRLVLLLQRMQQLQEASAAEEVASFRAMLMSAGAS